MNARQRLHELLDDLGDQENEIILKIAERLLLGQEQYGPFNLQDEPRDLVREVIPELIDAAIYGTAELVRIDLRRGR